MNTKFNLNNKNIINTYKLIYIPLLIVLIISVATSLTCFEISKKLLIKNLKNNGLNLATQATKQIENNSNALNVINTLLEDKIRSVGHSIIKMENSINNEILTELAKTLDVDEIHWMDSNGKTIYSSKAEYINWIPYEEHPLYDFIRSSNKELMEEIRPDAEFNIPIKYGTIKSKSGNFIQVGILADNIHRLTSDFNYQDLVEDLSKRENIIYASIVNTQLLTIADSDKEDIGYMYDPITEVSFKEALQGSSTAEEWYYEKVKNTILEVSTPIYEKNEIIGVLVMGISMEHVQSTMYTILITSFLISLFMFFLFFQFQKRNVIDPVNRLAKEINTIDIGLDPFYRIPIISNDTFLGINVSMNKLLDRIQDYFLSNKEYQDELEASQEEICASYEQLAAFDEELQAQYAEIQNYNEKLKDLKQKHDIAINSTQSAVWEVYFPDYKLFLSTEFENVIGKSINSDENVYSFLGKITTHFFRRKLLKAVFDYMKGYKDEIYAEIQIQNKFGNPKWFLIRGKGTYDEFNNLKSLNGIILSIDKLKSQEEYIQHQAFNDTLTGLPNRRSFLKKLQNSINNKKQGAVVLLDLDNFKSINDTLGHSYGDILLKNISSKLMTLIDKSTFISRFGGDEFLILLEEVTDYKAIDDKMNKIINIFNEKQILKGNQVYVTASMGISLYPHHSNEINQLLMNVDMAMYKVKETGKNNYMFYDDNMIKLLQEHVLIENTLKDSIKNDNFKLLYQPQICINTGEIVGFEALLRIKDKFISPAQFIPIAEKNGLIVQIGRFVLKESIKELRRLKDMGFKLKPIAINFSAIQLNDLTFIDYFKSLLKEYNIDSKFIEIEITESIFLDKKDTTIEFLNKLKSIGVNISLDDFGTGYSSLNYLTFVPVDKIKLDKSLSDKFLEINNVSVIDNIIALAHSLSLKVVAEGIETMDQYYKLKEVGCDFIQGYLFSKPLESHMAEKIYTKNLIKSKE